MSEVKQVSGVYESAAVLWLQFMVQVMIFPMKKKRFCLLSLSLLLLV